VPWLLLAAALGAGAYGVLRPRPFVPDPVARFSVGLPASARLLNPAGGTIAMSPDGARIVYIGASESGQRMLFLRSLDRLEPVPIPGTLNAGQPFFSHDGQWVGFLVANRVQKVALAGGPALTIATADSGFLGAAWGPDELIVFGTNNGLRKVPSAGGVPQHVTSTDSGDAFHALPDFASDAVVVFHIRGRDAIDRLAAVSLASGTVTRFEQTGSNPRYVRTGHLMYANSDGTIMAVPFDAEAAAVAGAAVPVVEGVLMGQGGFAKMGVSRGGAMVHATGVGGVRHVVLVDRRGMAQPVTAEQRAYGSPRFSPDGRRIALDITDGGGSSLWVFDVAQRTLTRLTTDRDATRPLWTPDGRRIAFTVNTPEPNLYWIAADGSAPMESLLTIPGRQLADGWSPDGRWLLYHQNNIGTTRNDIVMIGVDSNRTPRPLIGSQADEFTPAVSPDGRWLAYASDESGRVEIYVRPFPEGGGKVQVSLDGGTEPVWGRNGRELFYRDGDRMMAAAVRLAPAFTVTERSELFRASYPSGQFHAQYDVAPDGQRFVMTQGPQTSNDLVVVLHWFDQLMASRRAAADR
jgi:serine/threonine-protein kinase